MLTHDGRVPELQLVIGRKLDRGHERRITSREYLKIVSPIQQDIATPFARIIKA
jgi:hypothetical protein